MNRFAVAAFVLMPWWTLAEEDDTLPQFRIDERQLAQIVRYSVGQGGLLVAMSTTDGSLNDDRICDLFRSRYNYRNATRVMDAVGVEATVTVVFHIEQLRKELFKKQDFQCTAIWDD